MHKRLQVFLMLTAVLFFGTSWAEAQVATGSPYAIEQSVIASGGGTSISSTSSGSGSSFSITGTIGQPIGGGPATNAPFEVYSGFWAPAVLMGAADLSVLKTASPNISVQAGGNIIYTISLMNNSSVNAASTVQVTDALPAGTTFVSAAINSGMGWIASAPAAGGTGNVVFSKATVAASETAQFQIIVAVAASAASGTTINNTASVASATPDSNNGNNSSTAQTTVACAAAVPSITANPSTVASNSIGNTAATSANASAYAWTISNGFITSPANASSITYSAGSSGNIVLTLTITDANGCAASNSINVPITGTPPVTAAGSVLVSEFRTRGERGADDEFIELYNNTNAAINVGDFTIRIKEGNGSTNAPITLITLPAGATLPARGHYLLRKAGAFNYSLSAYAEADQTYSLSLEDGDGIAIFSSSSVFDASTLLDAVGFSGVTDALYKEGAGLTPATGIGADGQYSFVRRVTANGLSDTAENNSDFLFVSNTGGTFSGKTSVLGAPGPENSSSPLPRTNQFGVQLVEPAAASTVAPNRVRNTAQTALIETPNVGTMEFRRRWINNTGAVVTSLRFRLVDVTTKNSALIFPSQADLRSVSSSDFTVSTSRGNLLIKGLTLQAPSDQGTTGGGQNSSLTVALPAGGLAPGEALNVNFLVGVKTGGSFRFDIFIEALP